jgi:hypothetical protein
MFKLLLKKSIFLRNALIIRSVRFPISLVHQSVQEELKKAGSLFELDLFAKSNKSILKDSINFQNFVSKCLDVISEQGSEADDIVPLELFLVEICPKDINIHAVIDLAFLFNDAPCSSRDAYNKIIANILPRIRKISTEAIEDILSKDYSKFTKGDQFCEEPTLLESIISVCVDELLFRSDLTNMDISQKINLMRFVSKDQKYLAADSINKIKILHLETFVAAQAMSFEDAIKTIKIMSKNAHYGMQSTFEVPALEKFVALILANQQEIDNIVLLDIVY